MATSVPVVPAAANPSRSLPWLPGRRGVPATQERVGPGPLRWAPPGGPGDRGRDEPATDAVSLELSGYIGMDEDEPLPVAAVHEHGDVAVGVQLEPGLGLVVGDLGGMAHVHIVAPAPGHRTGRPAVSGDRCAVERSWGCLRLSGSISTGG